MVMKTQLPRTCTFSPVPATPVRLLMPALPTAAAICLHATLMDAMTVASSVSSLPRRSSCGREGLRWDVCVCVWGGGAHVFESVSGGKV